VKRIGVVVPAHNEELLLPRCLDAIEEAVAAVNVPTLVVVVLDDCTDASRSIAESRPWVTTIATGTRNVGIARSDGTAATLRWATEAGLADLWLATTDADSEVPPNWLTHQLLLASQGWEVVIGTVAVADWSEQPSGVAPQWAGDYQATEHHPHIHGANLGFSAEAYTESGDWPPLALHEAVSLVAAMSGRRQIRTATLPVVTRARRAPRAIGGFSDTLSKLVS
jgi:glycosyltransferase involved in cell wall biosynthesis